jgi:hypothetical protein
MTDFRSEAKNEWSCTFTFQRAFECVVIAIIVYFAYYIVVCPR